MTDDWRAEAKAADRRFNLWISEIGSEHLPVPVYAAACRLSRALAELDAKDAEIAALREWKRRSLDLMLDATAALLREEETKHE